MLITLTNINNAAGPETIAFGAGVVRRIRMLGLEPTVAPASQGVRQIVVSNVRTDSGGTATLAFNAQANSSGVLFQFPPNDGLDLAMDQPSTVTFLSSNNGTFTCFVGYDRVT